MLRFQSCKIIFDIMIQLMYDYLELSPLLPDFATLNLECLNCIGTYSACGNCLAFLCIIGGAKNALQLFDK